MAGYTQGFDDGGVIPDDDDAQAQAPTVADTTTPNAESPEQQQPGQEQAQAGAQPGFNPGGSGAVGQAVNGGVKKIVSYLMGEGAADPTSAKKFEQGIKHENPGISDDDANLMAVHKATELGGPAAGWAMVQYNRSAYNAKQSFAQAALNGIDGKAGNAQAAALAATQAGQHILDGSATQFTADPGGAGFTATVKVPGSDRRIGFQLTPQQFNQWLDVGKDGMWDKIMEQGTPASLQKIAQTQSPNDAQPTAPAGQGEEGGDQAAAPAAAGGTPPAVDPDTQRMDQEPNPNANEPTNFGKTPSTLNLSGSDRQNATLAPAKSRYSQATEDKSRAAFPWMSQEGQRQQFMNTQEDKEADRENRVDVAKETGKNKIKVAEATAGARRDATKMVADSRRDVAGTNADSRRDVANTTADSRRDVAKTAADARTQGYAQRAMQAAIKQSSTNANEQAQNAGKNLRAWLQSNPGATDDAITKQAARFGVQLPGVAAPGAPLPQAQAPQAQAPQPAGQQAPAPAQQQSRPANVPAGAKFYQGKWYTRGANGEAVPVS